MCELMKQLDSKNKTVKVDELTLVCRYHKNEGEQYQKESFLKGFKCLELFHSIYPRVLGIMYDAQFSEEDLTLTCPNSENTVTVQLIPEPVTGVLALINRIKELLRPLRPMDVVHFLVAVRVTKVKGPCYVQCQVGDTYRIPFTGTMCPQALYSLFPALLHTESCDSCTCPSNVNQIVFNSAS